MAQGRNLQMVDVLSHPHGPLSWALSTADGYLRKTNKSALANYTYRETLHPLTNSQSILHLRMML